MQRDAIRDLDGRDCRGQRVRIELSSGKGPSGGGRRDDDRGGGGGRGYDIYPKPWTPNPDTLDHHPKPFTVVRYCATLPPLGPYRRPMPYRGTSPIRKRPPTQDSHRTLGIGLR